MPTTGALILAAGRGTRMRSALPKVLHQAGGRSLLAGVLAAAREGGLNAAALAVVAGHEAGAVRAAVSEVAPEASILIQEPQLGTGHALQVTETWWRRFDQVLVLSGDMPLLSAATVAGLASGRGDAAALLATATPVEPRAYGRIVRDPRRPEHILAIVEDRQASAEQRAIRELNAGFYCFATAALAPVLGRLGTDNPHGEFYLTDAIAELVASGAQVRGLALADPDECLGVNDRLELAQLDHRLRRRKANELLRSGVTIQLPDTVVIDPEVEVGPDAVLEAGVQLLGKTHIGAGAWIGSHTVVRDSRIAARVTVHPHCLLESARVDEEAAIGPFARLRPGADIGRAARIGNFVEVKNSRVGAGSKANHLAYLGDAIVGEGANVGAGTITCNYDGEHKHRTGIGDRAFVGSNSTLVAPVEVGPGAYVAAGSVITNDVPGESLGLGRARQQNKPGWVARRREKL